jgi:hypothetical protein
MAAHRPLHGRSVAPEEPPPALDAAPIRHDVAKKKRGRPAGTGKAAAAPTHPHPAAYTPVAAPLTNAPLPPSPSCPPPPALNHSLPHSSASSSANSSWGRIKMGPPPPRVQLPPREEVPASSSGTAAASVRAAGKEAIRRSNQPMAGDLGDGAGMLADDREGNYDCAEEQAEVYIRTECPGRVHPHLIHVPEGSNMEEEMWWRIPEDELKKAETVKCTGCDRPILITRDEAERWPAEKA